MSTRRAATPEDIARARELREAGWSLTQIGAALGRSTSTIQIWVSPRSAARARQRAADYYQRVKPPVRNRACAECGGPVRYYKATRCGACRTAAGKRINDTIATLYRIGTPIATIAERVGLSEGAVVQRAHRLRDNGMPIPAARRAVAGTHPDYVRYGFIRKPNWRPRERTERTPVAHDPAELERLVDEQTREDHYHSWGEGGRWTLSLDAPLRYDGTKTMLDIVPARSDGELAALMEAP